MEKRNLASSRWIWLILLLYGLFAVAFSLLMPMWEAPDETAHFLYVSSLARDGRIPDREETYEALQPPSYYWLAAQALRFMGEIDPALARAYRPRLSPPGSLTRYEWTATNYRIQWGPLVLRWLNIPLGALAIVLVYRGAVGLAGTDRLPSEQWGHVATAGAATMALMPQYLHITSSINNDALAILSGAALFWLMTLAWRRQLPAWQQALVAGLALLIPFSVKLTALPMSLALLVALLLAQPVTQGRRTFWLAGGLALSAVLLVIFLAVALPDTGRLLWRVVSYRLAFVRPDFFTGSPLWTMMDTYIRSFWGLVGWGRVGLPRGFSLGLTLLAASGWLASMRLFFRQKQYELFLLVAWVALAIVAAVFAIGARANAWWRLPGHVVASLLLLPGLVWLGTKRRKFVRRSYPDGKIWAFIWLAALLTLMIVARNSLSTPQYQGRFLFPSLGPLTLLSVAGWSAFLPRAIVRFLPHLCFLTMAALNLYLWIAEVIPVFYQPLIG